MQVLKMSHVIDKTMDISAPDLIPLVTFLVQKNIDKQQWPVLTPCQQAALPAPYDLLLTNPLMTLGIEKYYQRILKIRAPLYTLQDTKQQLLSRAVLMIVDKDARRNQAQIADAQGQSLVVALGLIQIYYAALSPLMLEEILTTQNPFGALLAQHKIMTQQKDSHYFNVKSGSIFSEYFPNKTVLYGRTNTLTRQDNGQLLAHVVEILA
jgi:hypothetical protein